VVEGRRLRLWCIRPHQSVPDIWPIDGMFARPLWYWASRYVCNYCVFIIYIISCLS